MAIIITYVSYHCKPDKYYLSCQDLSVKITKGNRLICFPICRLKKILKLNISLPAQSKEGGGEEAEEKGDEEDNEGDENEKEGEVVEDDLEDWEEKLSHGPLYMLYLK